VAATEAAHWLLAGTAKRVELYDWSGRAGSGKYAIFDTDSATQFPSELDGMFDTGLPK
jgi:hypothetical protein